MVVNWNSKGCKTRFSRRNTCHVQGETNFLKLVPCRFNGNYGCLGDYKMQCVHV